MPTMDVLEAPTERRSVPRGELGDVPDMTPAQIRMANARAAKVTKAAERYQPDRAPTPSQEEIFMALNKQISETGVESIETLIGDNDRQAFAGVGGVSGKISTTSSAGKATMFRNGPHGWYPITVSRNAIAELVRAGDRITCGDCGSPSCSNDPNQCAGKEPVMFVACPVCNKEVRDFAQPVERAAKEGKRGQVQLDDVAPSSPEMRLRGRLQIHMAWKHKEEAVGYGINVSSIRDQKE